MIIIYLANVESNSQLGNVNKDGMWVQEATICLFIFLTHTHWQNLAPLVVYMKLYLSN